MWTSDSVQMPPATTDSRPRPWQPGDLGPRCSPWCPARGGLQLLAVVAVVVTGVEQPGVVPQPQGGHHHVGEDRAAAVRGQEVRSLPLTDEEDGEKVTWTLCSADYIQLVLPRFLSRHTKKKYVSSLENKQRKYTGMYSSPLSSLS